MNRDKISALGLSVSQVENALSRHGATISWRRWSCTATCRSPEPWRGAVTSRGAPPARRSPHRAAPPPARAPGPPARSPPRLPRSASLDGLAPAGIVLTRSRCRSRARRAGDGRNTDAAAALGVGEAAAPLWINSALSAADGMHFVRLRGPRGRRAFRTDLRARASRVAAFSNGEKLSAGGTDSARGVANGRHGSAIAANTPSAISRLRSRTSCCISLQQHLELTAVALHRIGEIGEVERQEVGIGQPDDRVPAVCARARP